MLNCNSDLLSAVFRVNPLAHPALHTFGSATDRFKLDMIAISGGVQCRPQLAYEHCELPVGFIALGRAIYLQCYHAFKLVVSSHMG